MPIYYSWRTVPFSLLCLFIFLLSVFPFFSRQVARVRCSLSTQNQLPTWLTIFSRLAVQNTSLLENTARKPATREAPLHKKKKKKLTYTTFVVRECTQSSGLFAACFLHTLQTHRNIATSYDQNEENQSGTRAKKSKGAGQPSWPFSKRQVASRSPFARGLHVGAAAGRSALSSARIT